MKTLSTFVRKRSIKLLKRIRKFIYCVNYLFVHKGKKMSGRMGNARSYMQNLQVRKVDAARNLIYVRGAVAGKPGSFCKINDAKLFGWEKHGMTPPFPTFLPDQDEKEGDPDVFYAPKDAKDPML